MARYTGPVCRFCRRHGEKLLLKGERCLIHCSLDRRGNTPPGGRFVRRRRVSERGLQLREKQAARRIYGILEGQFRRYIAEAQRRPGIAGENLLQLLERRLDNVVYRLGFGESRAQARQIVRHGHILLNGRKTDIPSALAKLGDVITWKHPSPDDGLFAMATDLAKDRYVPPWLALDPERMVGRVLALPSRGDIDTRIREQVIIEYYSR